MTASGASFFPASSSWQSRTMLRLRPIGTERRTYCRIRHRAGEGSTGLEPIARARHTVACPGQCPALITPRGYSEPKLVATRAGPSAFPFMVMDALNRGLRRSHCTAFECQRVFVSALSGHEYSGIGACRRTDCSYPSALPARRDRNHCKTNGEE